MEEQLTERCDLVDLARRLRPSALLSDTRPGSSRVGDRQFAFDDGRDARRATLDTDFARMIAGELAKLVRTSHAKRVILCASPKMLGVLRRVLDLSDDIHLDELARDLVMLTPAELREQLSSYGLLPG